MSPKLQEFYNELQKWIDSGFRPHHCFSVKVGVCMNLGYLLFPDSENTQNDEYEACCKALRELEQQFKDAGLHRYYPFNNGSSQNYDSESYSDTLWTNSKRLQWVAQHAKVD